MIVHHSSYTLGAQGNMPFEWPSKYQNTSMILPPSMQEGNWIHDAGDATTAALDHGGIGEGCHCPGGLYSDEGNLSVWARSLLQFDLLYSHGEVLCLALYYSLDAGTTNFNLTQNVVQRVRVWLQGCRPGCPWIGPNWQNGNWYDAASKRAVNVQARCPLLDDVLVNSTVWPAAAQDVMKSAGPRAQTPLL